MEPKELGEQQEPARGGGQLQQRWQRWGQLQGGQGKLWFVIQIQKVA